jgi:hypothetical protein
MSDQPAGGSGDADRRRDAGRGGRKGRRPFRAGGRGRTGRPPGGHGGGRASLGLLATGGGDFELVHPRGVKDVELDVEEGIELWKAGDPESARDALRYALSACHDNLWAHAALGRIALDDFHDPALARGHFGYAVELARRALPAGLSGRLPRERPNNRPLYDALEGLLECLKAVGRPSEIESLRSEIDRLAGGRR